MSKTKETILAADSLVIGLDGEYQRWNIEVQNMEKHLEQIPRFSMLAAAFVTYLSAAPEDIRRRAMDQWKSMLNIKHFELKRFLSTEREMLQWRSGKSRRFEIEPVPICSIIEHDSQDVYYRRHNVVNVFT